MKVLLFGGTFNPPHIGHCAIADHVRQVFGYDKVMFVPAFVPPHKQLSDDPGSVHRLAMVAAICAANPDFMVDACEIQRQGISYTVDTLDYLAARYHPEARIGLLIGDDLAAGFATWREPERILQNADIIIAHRESGASPSFSWPHREAGNPMLPISSSMIRKRIREGSSFRYLVPEPVFGYIRNERLYGYP